MKRIRFVPSGKAISHALPAPQPAKMYMPDWYRQSEMFISKRTGMKTDKNDPDLIGGLKTCVPFLDAMISGYMLSTWHDIRVTNDEYEVSFEYVIFNDKIMDYEVLPPSETIQIVGERQGDIGRLIPRPAGHMDNHFIWKSEWGARLPRGWSLMVTHPYNRFDLPFTTMTGFVDSDMFWTNGNLPFFLREGFEGIIPAGTPFAQLIPIKRKSWMAYASVFSNKYAGHLGDEARSVNYGYYRENNWEKKSYL